MIRKILCCLCLMSFAEFMQIEATPNKVEAINSEFELNADEKNLKNKIQNLEIQNKQGFEKIDNSFADVKKIIAELNTKLDTHEINMKNLFETIENKFDNLAKNLKICENQTIEKLENMLKIQNVQIPKINENKIKLHSISDQLEKEIIQHESFENQTLNALRNIETELKSENKKELKCSLETPEKYFSNDKPTDCSQWNSKYCEHTKCSVHNQIYGPQAFWVSCDQQTDNGGWTVIQRRINGSVDFYRNWADYKVGFGNIDGEFWIGLDKLHALTTTQNMQLRIILRDFDGIEKYANYDSFRIGNETQKYALKTLGKYDGNSGNSFQYDWGMKFTTKDQDNDIFDRLNCANRKTGGWWYHFCTSCNLNGKYYQQHELPLEYPNFGIFCVGFHDFRYSLKYVQMMIRPRKAA